MNAITLQFFDSNHLAWFLGFQYFFSIKHFYSNSSLKSCFVNHTKRSSAQFFLMFYLLRKKFPLVKRDNFASWTSWSVERWRNMLLTTKIVVIKQYSTEYAIIFTEILDLKSLSFVKNSVNKLQMRH